MSPNQKGATQIGRQLSDKRFACIQFSMFATNTMWAIGIGMQLPGQLVADTMCSDMPVSNQTLASRINGRFERLSVEEITTLLKNCRLYAS
jgi:hypothetical protein